MHRALEEVEWNTILFFVGLFILVGGVEKVGIFEMIAESVAFPARYSGLALSRHVP